jgi:hypothetical protein
MGRSGLVRRGTELISMLATWHGMPRAGRLLYVWCGGERRLTRSDARRGQVDDGWARARAAWRGADRAAAGRHSFLESPTNGSDRIDGIGCLLVFSPLSVSRSVCLSLSRFPSPHATNKIRRLARSHTDRSLLAAY